MNKRDLLENIPPEAWFQRGGPQGPISLWDLHPKWSGACFGPGYRRVYRDADPWSDAAGNIGFERSDGAYELVVFSRVSPMHHYDVQWEPGARRGNILLDGEPCPAAEAQASQNDPLLIQLHNRETSETIQLHLQALESASVRARAALESEALDPWKRVVAWYQFIRQNDPETYQRRLHNNFRQFLESTPPEAVTFQHLQYFQGHRLLPEALPELEPEQVTALKQEIQKLQAQMHNPQVGPRVPRILHGLAMDRLEMHDLQALIVMGAVKDPKSWVDRELAKLVKARPDIRRMWDTPNGRAQVYQLPEVLAIFQAPEAMQERTEAGERALRNQGALEGFDGQAMLDQQKMMQAQLGMYTGQFPQGKLPPPPWRVYHPYDPHEPPPPQGLQGMFGGGAGGGFLDQLGAWTRMGF